MTIKNFLLCNILLILSFNSIESQTLDGKWITTKGTTELTLEIVGDEGKIISLSSTKDFTNKILEGVIYDDIKKNPNNKWVSNRYTWKFTGVSRQEQENGRWEKVGPCQLSLSEDGNTLSASGHWTWKRKNPLTASKSVQENVSNQDINRDKIASLDVNYDGIRVNYSAYKTQNDTIVLIKIHNTLKELDAKVIFSNSSLNDSNILEPGNIVTKTLKSFPFIISIDFSKNKKLNIPLKESALELIKKKLKERISIKSETIVRDSFTITGVRG